MAAAEARRSLLCPTAFVVAFFTTFTRLLFDLEGVARRPFGQHRDLFSLRGNIKIRPKVSVILNE